MSAPIAVGLADEELQRLDDAAARGACPSRAAAVRAGLVPVLREEREARIEEACRAYGTPPEEDGVGKLGLVLGARLLAADAVDHDAGGA